MSSEYEWDVFISYRHRQPVLDWMKYHFYDLLSERLPEYLPYDPKIFIGWDIEVGSAWPSKLRHALKNSRCLVAVLSAEYFRSRWCLAEWHSMKERECLLGLHSDNNPSGLIYVVRFSDGDFFPPEAKRTQYKDLEKWNSKYPAFRETTHILDFEAEMKSLCKELAAMIRRCPNWQDWPVITPDNGNEDFSFPLPRLR
jgi:hypothetical protein